MNDEIKNLRDLSKRFRNAIEKCDPKSLPVTLQGFPYGACGDATLLLAKYLHENGCGQFDYVLGKRGDYSHVWLQRGDLIVDITADQFEDQNTPIIVTKDQSWYASFHGETLHIADFYLYDQAKVSELASAYITVKITGHL